MAWSDLVRLTDGLVEDTNDKEIEETALKKAIK